MILFCFLGLKDGTWDDLSSQVLPVSLIFVRFLSPLLASGFTLSSVAPGSTLVHKQTIVKERRRTQRGWHPGTPIQRTCATGVTPLRNRHYQKTKILTSAVIKSNDSRSAVLPVEVDVFTALTVERMGLNDTAAVIPLQLWESIWNVEQCVIELSSIAVLVISLIVCIISLSREDIRTANVIAAEAVTCLVIDRE